MSLIEAFPGQGGKRYDSKTPELDLLTETLENHSKLRRLTAGRLPDFVYGNSFGLYAALVVAGVVTFAVASKLARDRADIVRETEARREAEGRSRTGMMGVLGLPTTRVEEIAHSLGLAVTNYNGPAAHVISGAKDRLKEAEAVFRDLKKRVVEIYVEGAYHHVERLQDSIKYAALLRSVGFNPPLIPIICSTRPRTLWSPEEVQTELHEQMIYHVDLNRVGKIFSYHRVRGVVDVGPGRTLQALLNRLGDGDYKAYSLESDSEQIKRLVLN